MSDDLRHPPIPTAATERGLLLLLVALLAVVYYCNVAHLGVYEDDWSAITPYANGTWSETWQQVRLWLTHWPNGRPLGLGLCAVGGWGLYHLGGLPALYLLPAGIVLASAWTLYRILAAASGDAAVAWFGAVVFALLPIDTLRLSLHAAPHLYMAVFCTLQTIRAFQTGSPGKAAAFAFVGLLFHESATLTAWAGPLLFIRWDRTYLRRALIHFVFVSTGVAAVFVLRVFVFAEARATSAFSSLPDVISRSWTSLLMGTSTHAGLIVQRSREGLLFPVPGSRVAFGCILAAFAVVLSWDLLRKAKSTDRLPRDPDILRPVQLIGFGLVAFAVPYLVYFTDPYWPSNHIAGRMASVHSASGIGVAAVVAGVIALLLKVRPRFLGATLLTCLAVPLAALLSWGAVVRSQHEDAWANARSFWSEVIDELGNIKSGTLVFYVRETYQTPPFTWVIGSHSWADAIVLREIYRFPTDWYREPRLFPVVGPWETTVTVKDGKLSWPMPAGDWPPEEVTLEDGNVMIFTVKEGRPHLLEGEIEIAGHKLKLMNGSHGRRPLFQPRPLFQDLVGRAPK